MIEARRMFDLLLSIKNHPATHAERIAIQEQRFRENDAHAGYARCRQEMLDLIIKVGERSGPS